MQLFQVEKSKSNLLKDRYLAPPFSILNTISQNWQKRKRKWLSLGIESANGRDVKRFNATPTNTFSSRGDVKKAESISIFDPVLAEIMLEWFSLSKCKVLDPFAGGSVRGMVASILDRYYTGIDLSQRQVLENRYQLKDLMRDMDLECVPIWLVGDSEQVVRTLAQDYDMILTCPPYYNLEKYSNDPKDLSNLKSYNDFIIKFGTIMTEACKKLKDDSFAVVVVSEIRHQRSGEMYGFVADTIKIMQKAGLHYYNEIILENNIGSLPIRAPKYFDDSRKIGRQHQNVLVFYKGDMQNIREKFPAFS